MQALKTIRVIDLSHVIAGPTASYYLAAQGADVIKVEHPDAGDALRYSGKSSLDEGISASFSAINTGKQSLAIDLKHPALRDALYRLVEHADVFIENFKPGVAKRLGLDFETLSAMNQNLVYASISGYGQTGKLSAFGAYDHVIQAQTGMMMLSGQDDTPMKVGFPVIDSATGMIAAQAILGALLQRIRDPGPIRLDISMAQAAVQLMLPHVSRVLAQSADMPRVGNRGFSESPGASTFECADGWISIAANTPKQFLALCRTLKLSGIAQDPQLIDQATMASGRGFVKAVDAGQVQSIMEEAFRKSSAVALESALNREGVPASRVRTIFQFITEAMQENLVSLPAQTVDYPKGSTQNFGQGFFSNKDADPDGAKAPRLGEHTERILSSIGFDAGTLHALRQIGAVHF